MMSKRKTDFKKHRGSNLPFRIQKIGQEKDDGIAHYAGFSITDVDIKLIKRKHQ